MDNKWFKLKQRVEIHVETDRGILNLSTHIEEVTDTGEFIVAAPFYQGQLYPFLSQEQVELVAVVDHIGIVSCDVIISRKLRNRDIILLALEQVSEVRKMQRRRHYRLPTLLDTELVATTRGEEVQLQAIAKDISAGGLKCISSQQFYYKEHVKLRVNLNGEDLKLNSSVLESIALTPEALRFETRFEFEELKTDEEKRIVAYIFEEQRKRRSKT